MYLTFHVLTATLWITTGNLHSEAEKRDLSLYADLAIKVDPHTNAQNIWLKDFLSLKQSGINGTFHVDPHLGTKDESYLAIQIWKSNDVLCGGINIELSLKRDEALFLSNKLDFQRLLGRGSVYLELYAPSITSDDIIASLSESRKSLESQITKSHEFNISGFKIITD